MSSVKDAIISFAQDLVFSRVDHTKVVVSIELPHATYHKLKIDLQSMDRYQALDIDLDNFKCLGVTFKIKAKE